MIGKCIDYVVSHRLANLWALPLKNPLLSHRPFLFSINGITFIIFWPLKIDVAGCIGNCLAIEFLIIQSKVE